MNNKQRNRDFCRRCIEVYNDMEQAGLVPTIKEVVRRAIDTPAPSYYIDSYYAYTKILALRRTGTDSLPDTPTGRMWSEISRKVDSELRRNPGYIINALTYVLNFCHPSFFPISEVQGMRIARNAFLFRARYEHRPRRGKKAIAL